MKKQFEAYIRDHGTALTKLCLSLTNSRPDAEDLYQATWEKAMRHYRRYDPAMPFDKWLFTLCVNLYRDRARRYDNRKLLRFSNQEEQEQFLSSIPAAESDRDAYLALRAAVHKLKEPLREAIVLYYFRDYSIKELSEILGIPEGTVKSRLHTAREELRKELQDD